MKKILSILFVIIAVISCIFVYENYKQEKPNEKIKKIEEVKAHYANYVVTNKEAKLYDKVEDEYKEIGLIRSNEILELTPVIIVEETEYFRIENLNKYIYYKDIDQTEENNKKNDHYKNYVVFNESIVLENPSFYDDKGLKFQINQNITLPIIIKDIDKYYVDYANELLYVKKNDVKEIIEIENTEKETRNDIRTFTYHFVYKEGDECTNTYICHPEKQFNEHMQYLSENEYFTLTMNDLELFLDGKIRIPKKSIVITLDDGYLAKNAIDILEKYKLHATYFIITAWTDVDSLKSNYVELHSHTDNMHNNYKCSGGNQGGQLLCEDKNLIIEDLNKSSLKLNGSKVFCYPFYDYNDHIINILKELNFKMAFIGQGSTLGMANANTDKLKIPRLTLSSETTMQEFINYLK